MTAKSDVTKELFDVEAEVKPMGYEPLVHTMTRLIATTMPPIGEGVQPIYEIDAELSAWVAKGYKIIATHLIGVDIHSINMVYVLSK